MILSANDVSGADAKSLEGKMMQNREICPIVVFP